VVVKGIEKFETNGRLTHQFSVFQLPTQLFVQQQCLLGWWNISQATPCIRTIKFIGNSCFAFMQSHHVD
jgi:hypothetical protein